MSALMKAAKLIQLTGGQRVVQRAAHRGDPGILGFLGNALGSVAKMIPGVGTIVQGIDTVAHLGTAVATSGAKLPSLAGMGGTAGLLSAVNKASTFSNPVSSVLPPLPQLPGIGSLLSGGNTTQQGTTGAVVGTPTQHVPCAKGYHYNKTGYYTKRYGYIERGTVCVKNRRRNPLNPRAASRAMARLSSAKKATSFLGRVSIRSGGCGCRGKKH